MLTRRLFFVLGLLAAHISVIRADPVCFVPVLVAPQAHANYSLPVTLLIYTKGKYDSASQALFGNKDHWTVYYKASNDTTWTRIPIEEVSPKPGAGPVVNSPTLRFKMAKDTAIKKDGRDLDWTVTLNGVSPDCNGGSSALSISYSGTKLPQGDKFFSPVAANQTATVSLTGSFSAGGGTKPIYAIKGVGNIAPTERYRVLTMLPVITSEIDINQSVKASNEPAGYRSRIDPDSISVGGALWKVTPYSHGPLFDLTMHLQLADFEFARTDPSSAYTGGFGVEPIDKPWQNKTGTVALNSNLYFGLEAGRNLKKPSTLDTVPVDLTHYGTILRGVTGADVNFAVQSSDLTTVVFYTGATYRVRLPAFDEPFVTNLHQTESVGLSTKARNWVDVTLGYNPFHWQYFSFTAEYKYGSLPPLFSLVDHSATIGITFSAIQSSLVKF
jgi:hypothetical protein